MEALIKVIVHCKDLSSHSIQGLPEKVNNVDDVTKDIMKHGAYSYDGDVAYFIPPTAIIKIEYHKGEVPDKEDDDA